MDDVLLITIDLRRADNADSYVYDRRDEFREVVEAHKRSVATSTDLDSIRMDEAVKA